ncbi:MAG: helix-turn-helix domain-containing protein [Deltaproteobacteria bacterium]
MIGFRLRNLREEINLTQKELSQLLKLTPGAIGLYEQGRRMPDCTTLCTLADFYNVSVDYILCRTHNRNPERKASFFPAEIELLEKIRQTSNILSMEQKTAIADIMEETIRVFKHKNYTEKPTNRD